MSSTKQGDKKKKAWRTKQQQQQKGKGPERTVTRRVSNNPYFDALAPMVRGEIKSAIKGAISNSDSSKTSIKMEGMPASIATTTKGSGQKGPGGVTGMTFSNNGMLTVRQRKFVGIVRNYATGTPGAKLLAHNDVKYDIQPSTIAGDTSGVFPVQSGFAQDFQSNVTAYKMFALMDNQSMVGAMAQYFEFWQALKITLSYEPEANTGQHGMIAIAWTPQLFHEFFAVIDDGSTFAPYSNDYLTMSSCPSYGSANLYLPLSVTAYPQKSGIANGDVWLRTRMPLPINEPSQFVEATSQAGCWLINVDETAENELYGRLFLDVTYRFKGTIIAPEYTMGYSATGPPVLQKRLRQLAAAYAEREMAHSGLPPTQDLYYSFFLKGYKQVQEGLSTIAPPPNPRVIKNEFDLFRAWRKSEDSKSVGYKSITEEEGYIETTE